LFNELDNLAYKQHIVLDYLFTIHYVELKSLDIVLGDLEFRY